MAKDTESIPIQRFSVAHEIGHIFLGHVPAERLTKEQELTAERFASACVLWGLDLHTPEEIFAACNIFITSAKIRAERMQVLYSRGKFLLHPLERQVYKQFEKSIKTTKSSITG